MKDLIAKLEAASEGSPALDDEIHIAIHGEHVSLFECPEYSTSLDAALTLVPGGWHLQLFHSTKGFWFARLKRKSPYALVAPFESSDRDWGVPTPALALTIAALKARGS